MGMFNLRRRSRYFDGSTRFVNSRELRSYMTQDTWEALLACFRDCGFELYAAGESLPDGRRTLPSDQDPYAYVRRFGDLMQQHWRRSFVPGRALVVDETMIGWTGNSTMHMTFLLRKPIPEGLMLRIVCKRSHEGYVGLRVLRQSRRAGQEVSRH